MKEIDIIIPAYNSHKTIINSICSVLTQSIVDNCNITIVNDGGKNYKQLVKNFSPYCDIKEISYNENRGPGYARQYAIDHTNCPFIVFLDSDDTLGDRYTLQELSDNIKTNNMDMVSGMFVEEISKNPPNNLILHNLDSTWLHGKIYKREVIKKYNIRFPYTRANEDSCFNSYYMAMIGAKQQRIDKICYFWNYNENSITKQKNYMILGYEDFCKGYVFVIQELQNHLRNNQLDEFYFYYMVCNFILVGYTEYNNFSRSDIPKNYLSLMLNWFKKASKIIYFPYENKISSDHIAHWLSMVKQDKSHFINTLSVISFEDYIELLRN